MGMNIAGGAQKVKQELPTWASALTTKFGQNALTQGFSEGVQATQPVMTLPAWQQRHPRLH